MGNRKRVLIYIFFYVQASTHVIFHPPSPSFRHLQLSAVLAFFSTPTLHQCGRHKWVAPNHALNLSYASLFCQYQVFLRQLLCYFTLLGMLFCQILNTLRGSSLKKQTLRWQNLKIGNAYVSHKCSPEIEIWILNFQVYKMLDRKNIR